MAVESRKFRFGVTGRGESLAEWCDFARKAEDLGYSTLVIGDHVGRFFAPMPALVAAAQATPKLRFSLQTAVNDLRHPAVLASEAATADVLTDGRFELGLGAGSSLDEREALGLPQERPGNRVERVAEALQILKAFFTTQTVSYRGKHYQIEGLPAYPRPVQRPWMPIFVGANSPRMLRLAAREADIVSILTDASGGPPGHSYGDLEDKIAIVRKAASERYAALELHTWYSRVLIDGQPAAGLRANAPAGLEGSREQVIDQLVEQRQLFDVSYITVTGAALEAFAPAVSQLSGS
jgi:probable F420-dependent oxidoreductase